MPVVRAGQGVGVAIWSCSDDHEACSLPWLYLSRPYPLSFEGEGGRMKRIFNVLSLGAGVQSTALYLKFARGEMPIKLDAAIFADTQEELKARIAA